MPPCWSGAGTSTALRQFLNVDWGGAEDAVVPLLLRWDGLWPCRGSGSADAVDEARDSDTGFMMFVVTVAWGELGAVAWAALFWFWHDRTCLANSRRTETSNLELQRGFGCAC